MFLKLLEKLGRKKVLVNFAGEIIANRWYVFYLEEDEDPRWIAKLPNLYIHQNVKTDTPDGPDSHHHAWNTWSLILNGSYTEEVNGKTRYNWRWSIAKLKVTDFHRIVCCAPNTWTAFFHGFRIGKWGFKAKACATLCETCGVKYGACVNTLTETPYDVHFGGKGAWRAVRWFASNFPDLAAKIERRRRAIKKVKVLTRDEINARVAKERL